MNRSEMRTLGRIGQPLSGGTYRPRRRLRAPRWVAVTLTVAFLALVWVGVNANRQVGAHTSDVVTALEVPSRPDADRASRGEARTGGELPFASVDGLQMSLPHPKPVAIGFHEADRAEALAFVPVGKVVANDNAAAFATPADVAGPEYSILASLGRARPATSAVDVVVPLGDEVASPVTGTVTGVIEYPLTRGVADWRVEITPDARPDLTVVLVHLLHPSVKVGDAVTAGQTPLAVARLLPFESPIDAVLDAKQPHTHIEVKPSVASQPIDPNAPAAPADAESASG